MIKLHPKFRVLGRRDQPNIYIITGGRGASKSFGVSTYICQKTRWANHKTLYTRYTMTSAHDSVIPEFQEKIDLMGYEEEFYATRTKIANTKSKSSVIFRGIISSGKNQKAKLKSIKGVNTWVLDEAEELTDEDTFDTIRYSIRHPTSKNEIILILNPTTVDHWIWQRYFENSHKHITVDGAQVAMSTHPDVCHLHFTYLDNKHLPDDYVQDLLRLKESNRKKYDHKIIGGWLERAEGVVFENWEEGIFDLNLPHIYALDWGYSPDPLAVIKVAVDQRRKLIYAKEIAYRTRVDDVVGLLDSTDIQKYTDLIVCDVNEERTQAAVQKAGYNIQKAIKGPIVADIREINDYKLIVSPDSYNLKKELNNYAWNDKKASIPIDDYNHLLDGLRYGFRRLVSPGGSGVRRTN